MGRIKTNLERLKKQLDKRERKMEAEETKDWGIAKSVRQHPVKVPIGGSIPSTPANKQRTRQKV